MGFAEALSHLIAPVASGLVVAVISVFVIKNDLANIKKNFDTFRRETKDELQLIHSRMWDGVLRRKDDHHA